MDGDYVWFDGVRVEAGGGYDLHCIVDGKRVPLPIAILHPDCTLHGNGDVGRLGVPAWWAKQQGLLPDSIARHEGGSTNTEPTRRAR